MSGKVLFIIGMLLLACLVVIPTPFLAKKVETAPPLPARTVPLHEPPISLIPDTPVVTPEPDVLMDDKTWLNHDVRLVFDHYLLAYQEDEGYMWKQYELYCQPLVYCDPLTDLFKRFILYKTALKTIDGEPLVHSSEYQDRLTALTQLREDYFTADENDALFAGELAFDTEALARFTIYNDTSLTSTQKQELLTVHFDALPDDQKQALLPSIELGLLGKIMQSPQYNSYNQLAGQFGNEAATRLVELEHRQDDWNKRVSNYLQTVNELRRQYSDSNEELEKMITTLRQEQFNQNELKRLAVFINHPSLLTTD